MNQNGRMGLLTGVLLCLCLPTGMAVAGANCSISATSVNFGTYDPLLSQPDDSTASVTVTCSHVPPGTTNVSYTITVANGLGGSSATTRQMSSGTSQLGYNVFDDAARSQVLGTGTGGTIVARGSMTVGPGNGNRTRSVTHTFYGRVPQALDPQPGAYNDTLLLTLTY